MRLTRVQALSALLLAFCGACSRRAPGPAPAPSAAPSASVSPLPSVTAAVPACPGFVETATPWSGGGRIRSLQPADILELAVKAAATNGTESSWSVAEPPVSFKLKDAEIAVVALQAFGAGAIVSFRKDDFGYCSLGAWSDQFGGAGVQLAQVASLPNVSGYHENVVYRVMEGMNGGINGGGTSFTCRLVVMFFNRHGLREVKTTDAGPCREPSPKVSLQRVGSKLFLREGGARWEVGDY